MKCRIENPRKTGISMQHTEQIETLEGTEKNPGARKLRGSGLEREKRYLPEIVIPSNAMYGSALMPSTTCSQEMPRTFISMSARLPEIMVSESA